VRRRWRLGRPIRSRGAQEARSRGGEAHGCQVVPSAGSDRGRNRWETDEVACLDLALDNHTKPEPVDLLFFGQSCLGGTEAHELIAIGREAWASSGQGSWMAATITPSALDEIDQEQTDLEGLFAAVDVPKYTFEAPASAFPGADEELGDVQIEFEAVLDRKGFLRELVVHGEEDGTGATVTDKYLDVNQDLDIAPPDPSEVKGPKTAIRSEADLDQLFGGSSGSP
jgi:hypothetical protein